jgi:hypothetical protein
METFGYPSVVRPAAAFVASTKTEWMFRTGTSRSKPRNTAV